MTAAAPLNALIDALAERAVADYLREQSAEHARTEAAPTAPSDAVRLPAAPIAA